jgi:ribosomal-protein-alanine N-acetyltransferase
MEDKFEFELDFMKEEDITDVMQIERASFSMPWSRTMFMEELKRQGGRSYSLVARYDGKVIGYIMTWIVLDEAHIINIAVNSEYRRKGVAKTLLSRTLDYAKSAKAKKATLEVRVSNISAQNLYEKLGFKKVVIRRRFYPDNGEDAYLMSMEFDKVP